MRMTNCWDHRTSTTTTDKRQCESIDFPASAGQIVPASRNSLMSSQPYPASMST